MTLLHSTNVCISLLYNYNIVMLKILQTVVYFACLFVINQCTDKPGWRYTAEVSHDRGRPRRDGENSGWTEGDV